jgi:hypothetical protein
MEVIKMEMLKQKMGNQDLSGMAISIVILGIVTAVGATVLINVRDTNTQNSTSWNVSDKAALGLGEYGNWFKIIIIVSIAAVILGLIFTAFRGGGQAGGQSY